MPDTLATLRTLLIDRAAGSANDPIFDPTSVDRIINTSNRRLGRVADWPWLTAIGTIAWTANLASYDLSTISQWRHTKHLSYLQRKLKYESPGAYVQYNQETGTEPFRYTVAGNTLYLSPTPTAAVTINHVYTLDEIALTGDTSTPLLPEAYTELLILAALQPIAVRLHDTEMLNMARGEYKTALAEAIDEVRRTRQLPTIDADNSPWRTV